MLHCTRRHSLSLTTLWIVSLANLAAAQPAMDARKLEWHTSFDFYRLPMDIALDRIPWSGDYWPTRNGQIGNRWLVGKRGAEATFRFTPLSSDAVARLSSDQLAALSPAEKYDIIVGDYTYPLLQKQRDAFAQSLRKSGFTHLPDSELDWLTAEYQESIPKWEGLCHGWAHAALHFEEPKPIVYTTSDGLSVPLASSDIKALLSWFQGEWKMGAIAERRSLGTTCQFPEHMPEFQTHYSCNDVDPGAFHAATVTYLRQQKGLVMDLVHGDQVWNFPIYRFKTETIEERPPTTEASPEAALELIQETTLYYTVETQPSWQPVTTVTESRTFRYVLELNIDHEIIGGRWLAPERIDTIWHQPASQFTGWFKELGNIYALATDQAQGDGR